MSWFRSKKSGAEARAGEAIAGRADDAEAGSAGSGAPGSSSAPEPEGEVSGEVTPPGPRSRRLAPRRFSLVLVALLMGAGLFVGGYSLGAHVASTPGTPANEETRFGPFWDVYQLIQGQYAGSPRPSPDQLVQAAINGMMQALNDPWSYYQGPADFANSLLDVGGQAQGIGVRVQLQSASANAAASPCSTIGNGCELAIDAPIPGSPAEAAGIQPGDVIVSVDGEPLDGLTLDKATALIKGPKGTPVTLGILRNGSTISVSIVRNVFNVPEVTSRTLANGAVAYISIAGMNDPAWTQFRDALSSALAAGRKNIVLDLRGNLGGYVPDAVHIASQFIGSGTIVYQQDAAGNIQELTAEPGGLAVDGSIKVVVLVDGNTASAAEIVAGALQARGRAVLVGSKTYGKGVVQEWLPLPNDFGGIHLTVARWLTPDRTWIQGKGLLPDIPVDTSGARAGTDPVLDAALAHLGFAPASGASASPAAVATTSPGPAATPSPVLSPSPA